MNDAERVGTATALLRVEAPHFVAGAEFTRTDFGWKCSRAAPILAWMVGKYGDELGRYITRKRWPYRWLGRA
jgi:hypothetical protein